MHARIAMIGPGNAPFVRSRVPIVSCGGGASSVYRPVIATDSSFGLRRAKDDADHTATRSWRSTWSCRERRPTSSASASVPSCALDARGCSPVRITLLVDESDDHVLWWAVFLAIARGTGSDRYAARRRCSCRIRAATPRASVARGQPSSRRRFGDLRAAWRARPTAGSLRNLPGCGRRGERSSTATTWSMESACSLRIRQVACPAHRPGPGQR